MGSRGFAAAALVLAALALAPTAEARGIRLFHDSFSTAYRSPGGAVPTGTRVTLRLQITGGKAGAVTLRIEAGDPAAGTSKLSNLRMTRQGSYWKAVYRAPSQPSIVTYSFKIKTSRGVLWYGDDDSSSDVHKGGSGKTTASRGDSFQLT